MAQDAVKPITYFALKEADPLFGEAGRTIDSEIYEVLPKESRNKFKPTMKPMGRKPSWHPSNMDSTIIAMAEAPIPTPMTFADPDEDPDEDLEDEENDDDDNF